MAELYCFIISVSLVLNNQKYPLIKVYILKCFSPFVIIEKHL